MWRTNEKAAMLATAVVSAGGVDSPVKFRKIVPNWEEDNKSAQGFFFLLLKLTASK